MIEVSSIVVGYQKDINILQGVSLKAKDEEITAILGANGVGKSTLLKAVCGYLPIRSGKILLDGEDITGISPYDIPLKGVSYLSQRQSSFAEMTVEDNIKLGSWTFRKDKDLAKKRFKEIVDRFSVVQEKLKDKARTLSGGQQRIVEISRALMIDPKYLLMDEPSAGLAPVVARHIYDLVGGFAHQEGRTIVLVDQNIRKAVESSDYLYVLELGKSKIEGRTQDFRDLKDILW